MDEQTEQITVKAQEIRDFIYANREMIARIDLLHTAMHLLKEQAEDLRDKYERILSEQ